MKIKEYLTKQLKSLYKEYLYHRYKRLYNKDPKLAADKVYKKTFGRSINWDNPANLNEKIHWMLLNTDTSLWTLCADKYRVREYVESNGCENLLVDLYGVWENPNEIDFSSLPDQFVFKANNGCGTVKVVKNKKTLDERQTIKDLKNWISRPFGYLSAQSHYLKIKPCIIAEQLLTEDVLHQKISPTALIDYKVWCINGKPECILVIYGRSNGHYGRQVYDLEWNKMPEVMTKNNRHSTYDYNINIPKPKCLEQLIESAERLSAPFSQVRVDFYIVNNRIYFGELTFTAGMGSFTDEYYTYLGSKIDLTRLPRKR